MFRGTTPTLTFKMNTDLALDSLTQIWVTIKANEYEHTWDIDSLTVDNVGKKISLTFTQEETLEIPSGSVKVQIRMLDSNDKSYATPVRFINVSNILKEGIIE